MEDTMNCEELTTNHNYAVTHIGSKDKEMRIVCECREDNRQSFVLIITDIYKYFDKGVVQHGPIAIAVNNNLGSFGWDIINTKRNDYQELHIDSKSDRYNNIFRAIAKSVNCKMLDNEDMNYPG
jgi:hypothetical protein